MFQSCTKLKYVNIPSSISSIGTNPFNKCENLQYIQISEGNLHFSDYYEDGVLYDKNITKLISYPIGNLSKTFHIPTSIISIEGYSFELCIHIETIFIGKNVELIDIYAFRLCSSLKCIYYYGDTPPTIPANPFHDPFDKVLATTVMTQETYSSDTFAYLNVMKGTKNEECLPWPTQTFSKSNPFTNSKSFTQTNSFTESNTYTQSNTFTKSNTYTNSNAFPQSNSYTHSNTLINSNGFTKSNTFTNSNSLTQSFSFTNSLPNDITFSHSFVLKNSFSVTQTISAYTIHIVNTIVFTCINSLCNYYQTNIISYEYTVIYRTSLYHFYSNFYIMIELNFENNKSLTPNAVIGIICGVIASVLLIIGIIYFVIKHRKIAKTNSYSNKEQTTSADIKFEEFNQDIGENIIQDKDQWL